MRAKSNRVREGNGSRFQGRRKGKEKSFCFVVIPFLELCVICKKLMVYRVASYAIGEKCSVQDEENGPPVLSPEAHRT